MHKEEAMLISSISADESSFKTKNKDFINQQLKHEHISNQKVVDKSHDKAIYETTVPQQDKIPDHKPSGNEIAVATLQSKDTYDDFEPKLKQSITDEDFDKVSLDSKELKVEILPM